MLLLLRLERFLHNKFSLSFTCISHAQQLIVKSDAEHLGSLFARYFAATYGSIYAYIEHLAK